jgi:RND family efflux transporter MFP subunit
VVTGAVAAVARYGVYPSLTGANTRDLPLTRPVIRGTLRIVVTERGNLESVKTADGVCELTGFQNKITQLTPEGNHVEKGEIVCRFDSAEIDKNIAQQEIKVKQAVSKIETTRQEVEIQRNKAESDVIAATVELDLGEIDLEKYTKGDYLAETDEIKGDIGIKLKDLDDARNQLEQIKGLVKKGFKSPAEQHVAESLVAGKDLQLRSAQRKLQVKQVYEKRRKETEFKSKVDQSKSKVAQAKATLIAQMAKANSEFEAAKATATIEERQLKDFNQQKEKTEIKAEQPGIVAYANEPWFDSSRQIREGATAYSRQKIFSLPDMSAMQVKVSIHESLIKKIKPGQLAEIRVDAFPNLVIVGKVKTVSQLADSQRGWMSGGAKEYPTVVTIEHMPKEELRPGMTAEVKIMVGELSNSLIVPIQAISQHKGDFFAFVITPTGIERRQVKVGEANDLQVQVLEGLKEGDVVALDARSRTLAEFKIDESKEQSEKEKTEAKTAPVPKKG